ncbi:MAG: hypothetical protein HY817_03540 [Candidatus Abawacabacteria bacterium]|nr:hypothetical protein [Candidatus Abawacabacteria bacterium]
MNYFPLVRWSVLTGIILVMTACGQSTTVDPIASPIAYNSSTSSRAVLSTPSSLILPAGSDNALSQTAASTPIVPTIVTGASSIVVNNATQYPTNTPIPNVVGGLKQFNQQGLPFSFSYPQDWEVEQESSNRVNFRSPESAKICRNTDPNVDRVNYDCVPDMSIRTYTSEKDYLKPYYVESIGITTLKDFLSKYPNIRVVSTSKLDGFLIADIAVHNSESDTFVRVIHKGNMVYEIRFARDGISHGNRLHELNEQQSTILNSIHFASSLVNNTNMQFYSVSSAPFSFQYPKGWQVEESDNAVFLSNEQTLTFRKQPIPMQRTEGDSIVRQPNMSIYYLPDMAAQIGPHFNHPGIKNLSELLAAEKEFIQILGIAKVDGKTAIKVSEAGDMPPHQVWYIESGKGLYVLTFRQMQGDEPLTFDEQKIVDSLKLLK